MATTPKPRRIQSPKPKEAPRRIPKLTPNRILLLIVVAAAIIAGVVIGISVAGSGGSSDKPAAVTGAAETNNLLSGIPQKGTALGNPDAPVTLVEYADLACPYCAQWASDAFPTLVREYVRPGKVKLVFRGLAFVGPSSDNALRAVVAAGAQNRLWHVLELLYRNQGDERVDWATEDLVRSVGAAVPGLDAKRMLDERTSSATENVVQASADAASASGITSTPAFEVGRTGGQLERLQVATLDPSAFRPALDQLLGQ